jgi:RHS repeat-associated protein
MVALNGNFASDRKARIEQAESVQSEKSVDHPSSACLHRLRVENRFLFIGHNTDAYGNTLIYSGPGPDGIWFTDDDTGSGFTYGANDMIFCGYRYDPETRLYYVRNRMFLTDAGGISVGRWLQRDPIGYAGGVNLYEYVGGNPTIGLDALGLDCEVNFHCVFLTSAVNEGVRYCTGVCVELFRQDSDKFDYTYTCADLPRKKLVISDTISESSWFGFCSPPKCPKQWFTHRDYVRKVPWGSCSRSKCIEDCKEAKFLLLLSCHLADISEAAKMVCEKAADAFAATCVDGCAVCHNP